MCVRDRKSVLSDTVENRGYNKEPLTQAVETRDSLEQKRRRTAKWLKSASRAFVWLTQTVVLREEPEHWKRPIGLCDPVSERWIMWGPKGLWAWMVFCSLYNMKARDTHTHRTHALPGVCISPPPPSFAI